MGTMRCDVVMNQQEIMIHLCSSPQLSRVFWHLSGHYLGFETFRLSLNCSH